MSAGKNLWSLPLVVLLYANGVLARESPQASEPGFSDEKNTLLVNVVDLQAPPILDAKGSRIVLAAANVGNVTDAAPVAANVSPSQVYFMTIAAAGKNSDNLPAIVADAYRKARETGAFNPDEYISYKKIGPDNLKDWVNDISAAPAGSLAAITGGKPLDRDNWSKANAWFYDFSDLNGKPTWLKDDQGNSMTGEQVEAYKKNFVEPRGNAPSQAKAWEGKLREWDAAGKGNVADLTLKLFNRYHAQLAANKEGLKESREADRRLQAISGTIALAATAGPETKIDSPAVIAAIGELSILLGGEANQSSYRIPKIDGPDFKKVNHLMVDRQTAAALGDEVLLAYNNHLPGAAKFMADQIKRTVNGLASRVAVTQFAKITEVARAETAEAVAATEAAKERGQAAKERGQAAEAMTKEYQLDTSAKKLGSAGISAASAVMQVILDIQNGKGFDPKVLDENVKNMLDAEKKLAELEGENQVKDSLRDKKAVLSNTVQSDPRVYGKIGYILPSLR